MLVREAASALNVFQNEPQALLVGTKSLLTSQPGVGPLWWMCSHLLAASDTRAGFEKIESEIQADRTWEVLADAIPTEETVLISGWPETVLKALGTRPDVNVLVLDAEGTGYDVVRQLHRQNVEAVVVEAAHLAGAVEAAGVVIVEPGAVDDQLALTGLGGLSLAAVASVCTVPCWLVAAVGRRLPQQYFNKIVERTIDRQLPAYVGPYEIVGTQLFSKSFGPPLDCPMLPELC